MNGTPQEAKYVESWPNTNSAWASWSRFDILADRYGGVHSMLICTSSTGTLGFLPATRLASREILIEQNFQKRTRPALCVLCGYAKTGSASCKLACTTVHVWISLAAASSIRIRVFFSTTVLGDVAPSMPTTVLRWPFE